jgi:hypothetical protein
MRARRRAGGSDSGRRHGLPATAETVDFAPAGTDRPRAQARQARGVDRRVGPGGAAPGERTIGTAQSRKASATSQSVARMLLGSRRTSWARVTRRSCRARSLAVPGPDHGRSGVRGDPGQPSRRRAPDRPLDRRLQASRRRCLAERPADQNPSLPNVQSNCNARQIVSRRKPRGRRFPSSAVSRRNLGASITCSRG